MPARADGMVVRNGAYAEEALRNQRTIAALFRRVGGVPDSRSSSSTTVAGASVLTPDVAPASRSAALSPSRALRAIAQGGATLDRHVLLGRGCPDHPIEQTNRLHKLLEGRRWRRSSRRGEPLLQFPEAAMPRHPATVPDRWRSHVLSKRLQPFTLPAG
jgi:hypothetical protein